MSRKLLVVDDDDLSCRLMKAVFTTKGFEVVAAHDGPSGLAHVASNAPDVVVLDLRLPGGADGLEVLQKLRASYPNIPVLLLTAHAEVRTAVRATQLGAFDYLTKPVDNDEIVIAVRRALETRELREEVADLRRRVAGDAGLAAHMGASARASEVIDQVREVAPSDLTVLILGETGTGKELVAQAIHRQSERRLKPLIALDCGAIPESLLESELFGYERGAFSGADRRKEGRFQIAEGGTFFLDEVGNLSAALQAKLLRVLESRQVQAVGATKSQPLDVRFIAATNFDLETRVRGGQFRADLYFRLAQYTLALPPLRERPADIPHLAQRFLEEAGIELRRPVQRILPEAIALLQQYSWPGNVRELRNVIRQAVLKTRDLVIRPEALPSLHGQPPEMPVDVLNGGEGQMSLREIADEAACQAERQAICAALRVTRGNKSRAARVLKTDYKTLHLKIKHLGICVRDFDA